MVCAVVGAKRPKKSAVAVMSAPRLDPVQQACTHSLKLSAAAQGVTRHCIKYTEANGGGAEARRSHPVEVGPCRDRADPRGPPPEAPTRIRVNSPRHPYALDKHSTGLD